VRRRRFIWILGGGLVWSLEVRRGGEDPSLSRIRSAGVLRVGLDPSYPPFANYDGAGQLGGLDVDLAREIARRIGVAAEIVALDSGGLIDAVVARKCDAAMGVPPARELLRDLRYSQPYFDGGQVLVRRRDQPASGQRAIGVEAGSEADLQWARISKSLAGASLVRYPTLEDLVAALRRADVAEALVDAVTAHQTLRLDDQLLIASEPLTGEPIVVAVHKDDARLLREIDAVLSDLTRDGFLGGLMDRWLR
jgi:ABC-type amino acid transport substrate-binding protein